MKVLTLHKDIAKVDADAKLHVAIHRQRFVSPFKVHFPEKPERAPVVYRVVRAGTLIGRAHKALVGPGDFLALIATDM